MPITYTRDIPDAPNNPSVDQGPMKTNTNSIDTIIAVDHYTFADIPSGTHKQVTISGKNAGGVQTDPSSVLYTASGTASTVADLRYRNQNGIFTPNCIRAFASFAGSSGAIQASQSINVTSITRNASGNYSVVLTANAVTGTEFLVLVSCTASGLTQGITATYALTGAGTFDIFTAVGPGVTFVDCTRVCFTVIQL